MTTSDSSSVTMIFGFEIPSAVADALASMWFEMVIFLSTLCLAFLMKNFSNSDNKAKRAKAKLAEIEVPTIPHATKANAPHTGGVQPRRRTQEPSSGQAWRSTRQQHLADLAKDLPRCVDTVCELVGSSAQQGSREGQQPRPVGMALDLFEELERSNGCIGLKDIIRTPKGNRAMDFYCALVQCAIRLNRPQKVSEIITSMRNAEIPRTLSFYESAMKILAGKKLHHQALDVYDEMVKDDLKPSAVTMSCLVSFAVEIDEPARAVEFFDKLAAVGTPSIRAYMTILRVYSKQQNAVKSIELIRGMEGQGMKPDNLILNTVLSTCVNAGKVDEASALLFEFGAKDRALVDVISFNTVVKGLAQQGRFDEALKILDHMAAQIPPVTPNSVTFNTIMDAAVREGKLRDAWKVLASMKKAGLKPDKYTCSILVKGLKDPNSPPSKELIQGCLELVCQVGEIDDANLTEVLLHCLLDACIQSGQSELVMTVFGQMTAQMKKPSQATFGAIIRALGQTGDLSGCFRIWRQMLDQGVEPNASSLGSLADACVTNQEPNRAVEAFEEAQKWLSERKLSVAPAIYISMVRALCKAKDTKRALEIYQEMMRQRKQEAKAPAPPGLGRETNNNKQEGATLSMLVRGLVEAGNLDTAFMVLADMRRFGYEADESIFNAFLNACFRDENADLAKNLFDDMETRGVKPNSATFSILIKIFGRCRRLEDAFATMEKMSSKYGIEPSVQTYTCLAQACTRNRQTSKALDLVERMKALGSRPDRVLYSTLINGCAYANFLTQGVDLLEEALQAGFEVPAETLNNLMATAARKRGTKAVNMKLRSLVEERKLPVQEKMMERLVALLNEENCD